MSNEVLIALISALSAISGSVVTIISNYLIERLSEKRKNKKEQLEILMNHYTDFINNLQLYMNESSSLNFNKFVKSLNKIKLIGSDNVVSAASSYYVDICMNSKTMAKGRHEHYQNIILSAMREDILMKKSKMRRRNLHLIANKVKEEKDNEI